MQLKELIRKKREGGEHTPEELRRLVDRFVVGELKDYQMAAWLMAVYFKGLTDRELDAFTVAMWKSGSTFPRTKSSQAEKQYWIDKHSTGGIGDKTSLILVPLVAAVSKRLGEPIRIPMVSGRGLGHSAGTLDKLESIPGFRVGLGIDEALKLLDENGFFIMGQTKEVAPADGLIYALRDATDTVASIPLIVASIMSKKLSEHPDGLVFDLKRGSGAFMQTEVEALALGRELVGLSARMGVDAVAVLTSMDEPLGWKIGHALEVEESFEFLSGSTRERGLTEVTLRLAAWMVSLSTQGRVSVEKALEACERELETEAPREFFLRMVKAQGGQWSDFQSAQAKSARDLSHYSFKASATGYLSRIEARSFGVLLNEMGGGRNTKDASIDLSVGMIVKHKIGDRVEKGEVLVEVLHRPATPTEIIENSLAGAVQIQSGPCLPTAWIGEILRGDR